MYKNVLYLLLLLCCTPAFRLAAQEWEPVCEQGICIQPFDKPIGGSINDVPNVYAEEIRLRGYGNSGSQTDYAAWSDNTTTSFLLLSHTNLSSDYEYRIRVFAKTKHAGKTIDFGLTTAANMDNYYPISENHPVTKEELVSATGTEI
ncbi:MAG: hypothetical protein AAGJ93_12785, partial [Bacteroidota bacterium]